MINEKQIKHLWNIVRKYGKNGFYRVFRKMYLASGWDALTFYGSLGSPESIYSSLLRASSENGAWLEVWSQY